MLRYLFVILFLQSAYTAPIEPCVKFRFYLMQEFTTLIRASTIQFSKLLQLIVEEADRVELSEIERQILDRFTIIIEHSKQMDDSDDILIAFDILDEIFDLLDSFESDESDSDLLYGLDFDASDDLIDNLFLKFGMDSYEQIMENIMNETLQRIGTHVESYLKLIKGNDLLDLKYSNWLTEFKSETDIETKCNLLEEFMEFIDCKMYYNSDLVYALA